MVVVGTDLNLLILLSKVSHHSNAQLCNLRTGDIYPTIQPSQRLSQCQHINSKNKTFKLIHKRTELEHNPIEVFQYVLFVNSLCTKRWILFRMYFRPV